MIGTWPPARGDTRDGGGGVFVVDRDAHQFRPGGGRAPTCGRRPHIGGVGVGHGLDCAGSGGAPHLHAAHVDSDTDPTGVGAHGLNIERDEGRRGRVPLHPSPVPSPSPCVLEDLILHNDAQIQAAERYLPRITVTPEFEIVPAMRIQIADLLNSAFPLGDRLFVVRGSDCELTPAAIFVEGAVRNRLTARTVGAQRVAREIDLEPQGARAAALVQHERRTADLDRIDTG